jgi:tRNA(Met) C34 N-acetyltransferase TmcA
MEAAEKEILRYFKQDAVPLFNQEEMRKIYSLALQAGMKNEPEENRLLDGIIHKAECSFPGEGQREAPVEEQEALPGDVIR